MFGRRPLRILLPLDLGAARRRVFDAARELCRTEGSEVLLFHVVETIEDVPFEELESFYARLERRAHTVLGRWEKELADAGVSARSEVVFGSRAPQILDAIESRGIDLLLLATPAQAGLGSLGCQLAVLSPVSVLLVKEAAGAAVQDAPG